MSATCDVVGTQASREISNRAQEATTMNSSSQRIFLVLVAVVFLAFIAQVHAQEFGDSFEDGGPSGGLSGDYKRGSRYTLTEHGVLNMMKAFLDGQGGPQTGFQNVTLVLYQDANGVPG